MFGQEVDIIFNNVNEEEEKEFQYVILEINLNPANIKDLIAKIKRDKIFFKKIINKKILFLGFFGPGKIKKSEYQNLSKIKCVLYAIKNNQLCGRNLLKQIDWSTAGKVIELKKAQRGHARTN